MNKTRFQGKKPPSSEIKPGANLTMPDGWERQVLYY